MLWWAGVVGPVSSYKAKIMGAVAHSEDQEGTPHILVPASRYFTSAADPTTRPPLDAL